MFSTGSTADALLHDRGELKFALPNAAVGELLRAFDSVLAPHEYRGDGANPLPMARHYTTTVYFDTPDGRLVRAAASGRRHVKLRAREYYDVHPELAELATDARDIIRYRPVLWLELKTRDGDRSEKTRVGIPKTDVLRFLATGEVSDETRALQHEQQQTLDAVRAFVTSFDRPLEPSCLVNYRRVAFQDGDATLRVTVDRRVSFFAPSPAMWTRPLVHDALGEPVARESRCIVEVKAAQTSRAPNGQSDAVMQLLSQHGAEAVDYSKFIRASRAIRAGQDPPGGGVMT